MTMTITCPKCGTTQEVFHLSQGRRCPKCRCILEVEWTADVTVSFDPDTPDAFGLLHGRCHQEGPSRPAKATRRKIADDPEQSGNRGDAA